MLIKTLFFGNYLSWKETFKIFQSTTIFIKSLKLDREQLKAPSESTQNSLNLSKEPQTISIGHHKFDISTNTTIKQKFTKLISVQIFPPKNNLKFHNNKPTNPFVGKLKKNGRKICQQNHHPQTLTHHRKMGNKK